MKVYIYVNIWYEYRLMPSNYPNVLRAFGRVLLIGFVLDVIFTSKCKSIPLLFYRDIPN